MSERTMPEMNRFPSSLHRDEEEDLIDYGDSDAEAETKDTTAPITIEEIDIFADDSTHAEASEQPDHPEHLKDDVGEPTGEMREVSTEQTTARPAAPPASTTPPTTTKTAEAATVIKSLNDFLTKAEFRAALGLVEPSSSLDLSFWADGLDFKLSLKLVGAAEVKACRYGAECRNKDCTFNHGGADRTAIFAGKKIRKYCSKINTPMGCPIGDACWFSHEAFGVACAHGDSRSTCIKGTYCVYKHSDDEVVASVENVEQTQKQINNRGESNEAQPSVPSAAPVDYITVAKTDNALPAPAPSATTAPKQHTRSVKRGREPNDEAQGKPEKVQRVEERRNRQEHSRVRIGGRGFAPERADSGNPDPGRRGSGGRGRDRRDGRERRGGGVGRSDAHRPSEETQRGGRKRTRQEPLEKRVTRG